MMNVKMITKLELDAVLKTAAKFSVNEQTKKEILNLKPSANFKEVGYLLELTRQADKILFNHLINPLSVFDDVAAALEKAAKLSTLTPKEFLQLGSLLRASRICFLSIQNIADTDIADIKNIASAITVDKKLEEQIEKTVLNEDEISDNASEKLCAVRKQIRKCNDDIRDKLNSFIRSSDMQKYLQDNLITIRNDRFVIPVKQEYKNSVSGLIHDQSASGATVFIEPMQIVELNNKLKTLVLDEHSEIERILQELTARVHPMTDMLKININQNTMLDIVFSKAAFSHSIRAINPKINNKGRLNIINGRHPLIGAKNVVPISINLGFDFDMLLVTGPNTGGKTVTLKTVGLFTLMTMCGIFIPADIESEISIFENIFCDIGDEQSIEQSLSTFSSHIIVISDIMNKVNERSLVLLDELGAGTDPYEGAALAKSIVDFLKEKKAYAIITTHYSELKEYSLLTKNIENASMEFCPETFAPTYRLNIGIPGTSNAIEIAKRLGLNQAIIDKARGYLSADKKSFEKVLHKAEELRQKAESNAEKSQTIKAELEKEAAFIEEEGKKLALQKENFLRNAKLEAKRIVAAAQQEAEETIAELKKMLEQASVDEQAVFKARRLKKRLAGISVDDEEATHAYDYDGCGKPVDAAQLKIGDAVFVKKLNSAGRVLSKINQKNEVCVSVGSIKINADIKELFYAEASKKPQESSKVPAKSTTSIAPKSVAQEINVLGHNVDEAIYTIDAYIDDAVLCGLNELKIVHGTGTGALKNGLHRHFKTHPNVQEFRSGVYGEGESGVTIIKLK
jgi:DNA mismatch repair protein MutS2